MPKKPRSKRKYSPQVRREAPVTASVSAPQATAQTKPVASSNIATPAKTPTSKVKISASFPYIRTELRTIGIIAGIMLVLLIAVSLIFS